MARRALGKPLVRQWPLMFEIGTLFYRHQFNHALSLKSMAQTRAYFDSLYVQASASSTWETHASTAPEVPGTWFTPVKISSPCTLLYFHGGGYAFYADVTRHFIGMLSSWLEMPIFAVDYRLTPEHPHPAQIHDALAAYRGLLNTGMDPAHIVIGGDSAGGHLMLMTLIELRKAGLPQPRLALGLSPWTDIGRHGDSQFGNDRYDMVQGYQTLLYGQWLKGDGNWTDAQLSPINQELHGLAPIYLQAGGKEILVDMIRDFAHEALRQGARVRLDVWEHMTHEFHGYGDMLPESRQALNRLKAAMAWARGDTASNSFPPGAQTEVEGLEAQTPSRTS